MVRSATKYLSHYLNPLNLLQTKKILQVNPTVIPERKQIHPTRIHVYDFNADTINEGVYSRPEECYEYLNSSNISWINVDGLNKAEVEQICLHYGIHTLFVEDILTVGQRPKMDEMDNMIFCLLHMLYFNEANGTVESEQVSLVLGRNFVISFQEDGARDLFDPVREKLKIKNSRLRSGTADYLLYALIDSTVDHYFKVMEKLGEKIEALEEDVLRNSNTRTLARVNLLRKEMIVLKRTIAPVRELVNGILKSESELINERTEKYFKDIYDHIVQAHDLSENYRDMMMTLQDLYLNNVNLKLNEVMKFLAVVTTLLAPATVIGGMFGMNFEVIPFSHHKKGFIITVGAMLVIPLLMLFWFRRKRWI